MGQILHGSATTTEAVRRAIQHSQESLRALGKRYGVNPKTIAKWLSRGSSVSDLRTGPKEPRSTVLSVEEEAVDVGFRAPVVAARRLPIRPAADRLASDALVPTPVSAAPRDLSAAAGRRRSLRQAQVHALSDRLFSYRHRRSSNRAAQLYCSRHRSDVIVPLRRVAREVPRRTDIRPSTIALCLTPLRFVRPKRPKNGQKRNAYFRDAKRNVSHRGL